MNARTSAQAWVLDASVTASWLLPDEHTVPARRAFAKLRSGVLDVHAPELWLWECGNIVVNGVRRQRVAAEDASLLWSVLDAVRSRVQLAVLEPAQVRACAMLAVESGLSIYDSVYLWLALSMNLPLMTHDRRLREAARGHGAETLALDDVA